MNQSRRIWAALTEELIPPESVYRAGSSLLSDPAVLLNTVVAKNPTRSEYLGVVAVAIQDSGGIKPQGVRFILSGDDIYVWYGWLIHTTMLAHLGLAPSDSGTAWGYLDGDAGADPNNVYVNFVGFSPTREQQQKQRVAAALHGVVHVLNAGVQ